MITDLLQLKIIRDVIRYLNQWLIFINFFFVLIMLKFKIKTERRKILMSGWEILAVVAIAYWLLNK